MPEEENRASGQEEQREPKPERETSGQYLWRVLRPAGAIAVLLLFIAFLVMCFTTKGDHPLNAALIELIVNS